MTPTTDELAAVLERASTNAPQPRNLAGRAAHHGLVIRRQRTGVVVAAVALAVAAVALPTLVNRTTTAQPVDGPTPAPTAGDQQLPTYLRGGRLVATTQETNRRGVTLTFTPTTMDFGFVDSCASPTSDSSNGVDIAVAEVLVNGQPASGSSCSSFLTLGSDGDFGQPHAWADYGVKVGEPVTVAMGPGGRPAEFGVTTWRLAVYEAVPLDEYPFPDPPAELKTPDEGAVFSEGRRLVFGDGSTDPEGYTYTVPVQRGLELRVETVEPGEFQLLVNGVVMATNRSWTYQQEGFGEHLSLDELGIQPGDEVELSFRADRFTGNTYRFAVYDAVMR